MRQHLFWICWAALLLGVPAVLGWAVVALVGDLPTTDRHNDLPIVVVEEPELPR